MENRLLIKIMDVSAFVAAKPGTNIVGLSSENTDGASVAKPSFVREK